MKKVISLLTVVAVLAVATASFAVIANTKHDLSADNSGAFTSGNTGLVGGTQICVFCHTPHNVAATKALWNRNATVAGTYAVYTSGIKLRWSGNSARFTGGVNNIGPSSPSYLCMTCHDGATSMNAIKRNPESVTNAGKITTGGANLGTTLTNDHPVSVDYVALVSQIGTSNLVDVSGTAPNVKVGGVLPLVGNSLECSSCHNVHDNTFTPFLRLTMTNSALCLACHVK